jgi:hypothetical protein
MAFNFTPERTVLNFGPRNHTRWSFRQFLLWPAWAYRVVAPRIRERHLNVFQRAVMGLCRAGLTRVEDLAESLSVHNDLAAFIVAELTELGYLNTNGLPTENGLRVLEDDSIDTHDMVAGYVFQDPWTGDLWPRFVERLDYSELEYNEVGFPSLLLGTKGKPRRLPAFTVLPNSEVLPVTPSPSAIVEAVSRHRRGLRFSDANDVDEEDISDFVASGVQIDRVSFVEEDPQPVFLTTYIYVPESEAVEMDWYVCDPFGLGQSARLRRRVESVMHEVPALFDVVNRVVGNTLFSGYEDQRKWLETLQFQAGLEIEHRLTTDIRTHDSFEQLLAMESAHLEMRSLGAECPKRKIDEVLRAGLKVLEAIFSSIAVAYPLGDIWKRVYVQHKDKKTGRERLRQQQDSRLLEAIYKGVLRNVGFKDPFPKSLVNIKPGQIRSVAERGEHWRLRPLVTAIAMLADRETFHPLKRAAGQNQKLLDLIDEIASAGGGAGHASGRLATPDDAEAQVERVYSVVSTLIQVSNEQNKVGSKVSGEIDE